MASSSSRYNPPYANAWNANGAVAVGNVLTFWVSGGGYATPKSAYTDAAWTVPITSITAGADGKYANIFLGSGDYGIQERDINGVLLWSADPVSSALTTAATTSVSGTVQLATVAQALAATSAVLAMTPATTAQAIQQGFGYGTTGGTANAITGTPTITPTALAAGMLISLKASSTNTGATTLNWAGLGAVAVKVNTTSALLACYGGEIINGNTYIFEYSAADACWILLTPSNRATWPPGTISGLTLSRASATTFGIAVGYASNEDSGVHYDMTGASAFTKSLSAWVVGTGNGGLDTGAVGASTWYHVHMIRKDTDGSIDYLYSLSVAAPTMPTGYTARRRIGSILTNGASQIVSFFQLGDEFLWDVPVIDVDATNPGTAAVTRTLTTPLGIKVTAILTVGVHNGSSVYATIVFSPLDITDAAGQIGNTAALTLPSTVGATGGTGTTWLFANQNIRTNTSSQIRSRMSVSGAADHTGVITRGWIDTRGKN